MKMHTVWVLVCVSAAWTMACEGSEAFEELPAHHAGTGAPPTAGMGESGSSGAGGGAGMGGQTAAGAGGGGSDAGTGGGLGGTGGGGGAGGTGGMPEEPWLPPEGDPIEAPDGAWTWIPFADSRCRSGNPAGISVNLNSASDKVMIYLEGGGACFDFGTCFINPGAASATRPSAGVFNRDEPDNPVRDWNFVYVPYCTGDVHAGDNSDGRPGTLGDPQQFRGYRNLEKFLDRVVPTFLEATHVVHTGISAGGFGAALTADLVQRKFGPSVKVALIDDSGPPMRSQYLPTCVQQAWRELWGFDRTFLVDCGTNCPDPNDFSVSWSEYMATKYSDRPSGLISSLQDSVISAFFNIAAGSCGAPTLSAARFQEGLEDFRSHMQANHENFGTFFIPGSGHTFIGGSGFYTTTINGVRLVDWFRDIAEGVAAGHVAP